MMEDIVRHDFDRARQKAFMNDIVAIFRRRSNRLIPYSAIRERVSPDRESYRGMQAVPVAQIIGSVDRFRDFDGEFLPRHNYTAGRWKNVDRAYHEDVMLPPVQLYKMGDVYFVKDGNHRVSVAKERGVEFIDAEVIESHVRVPLYASMRPDELLRQVEYAEFLRRTDLDRLRPDHDIQPGSLGRYDELWEHIEEHAAYLRELRGTGVTTHEAVTDWYDEVYLPVVRVIRERGILGHFPKRSEADLYLWVMAHRLDLADLEGQDVDPEQSAVLLADKVDREAGIGHRITRLPRFIGRKIWRPRKSSST